VEKVRYFSDFVHDYPTNYEIAEQRKAINEVVEFLKDNQNDMIALAHSKILQDYRCHVMRIFKTLNQGIENAYQIGYLDGALKSIDFNLKDNVSKIDLRILNHIPV
jgi:hypothetical protein